MANKRPGYSVRSRRCLYSNRLTCIDANVFQLKVYDPSIIPALVSTLVLLLDPNTGQRSNKIALIALTIRNPATIEMFLEAARRISYQLSGL